MQGAADAWCQQQLLLRLPQHDCDNLLSGGGGRQQREAKNVMSRKSFPPSSVHPHLDLSDRSSRCCNHNSHSGCRSERRTDSRRPIPSLTPCIIPSSSPTASSQSLHPMLCPLLLLILLILSHVAVDPTSAHPISRHHRPSSSSSSSADFPYSPDSKTTTCHGMQPHTLYHYSFRTHMILNNNDQKVSHLPIDLPII